MLTFETIISISLLKHEQKGYLASYERCLAARSRGVCVKEPLQEEQLHEACQDDERALRRRPTRHVVEVREQDIVIRSSPHSG